VRGLLPFFVAAARRIVMSPRPRLLMVCLAVLTAVVVSYSSLQAARQPAPPPARPAGQAAPAAPQGPKASEKFMNLKVLGDMPASQLREAMVFMSAALGFTCESCHVRKPDGEFAWEKDDKDNKVTARKMLTLTKGLNTDFFDGQPEVSCATCHQGRRSPVNLAPLAQPFTPDQLAQQAAQAALAPGTRPPAPKETSEQVLSKYYEALGGQAAVQTITSAVMRGTATNRAGISSPAVVTEKAPGRYRIAIEAKTPFSRGFDGTAAWVKTGETRRELTGVELQALARDASPWLAARLAPSFTRLQVGRYERIDGHDVVTLNGVVSPDVSEALSFDRSSGLLLRRLARLRTPMGRVQVQVDYADYRAVDGVKVPFEVKIADWESVTTLKFSEVKLNAPVEDSVFAAAPSALPPGMDSYFFGLLYRGPAWTPGETDETKKIQEGHMANIQRMADVGALVAAGPIEGGEQLRGIFIFRVKTAEEARALAANDPAIKAGRLTLELHPWIGPAGIGVRYAQDYKADPSMKVTMRTYQLGLLKAVDGAPKATPEAQRAHLQNIAEMQAAGKLAAVGPVTDEGTLRGILVFKTDGAEAKALASADPHVKAGRLRAEIFTWWCAEKVMPDVLPPAPVGK
jgi:uncharacterized protein YciI